MLLPSARQFCIVSNVSEIPLPANAELLLPTLRAVDVLGGEANSDDINRAVVKLAGITQAQLEDTYGPDSRQKGPRVFNRIAWARTLLKQVDQLRSVSPGV